MKSETLKVWYNRQKRLVTVQKENGHYNIAKFEIEQDLINAVGDTDDKDLIQHQGRTHNAIAKINFFQCHKGEVTVFKIYVN